MRTAHPKVGVIVLSNYAEPGGGTVLDPLVVEALLAHSRSAPTLSRLPSV